MLRESHVESVARWRPPPSLAALGPPPLEGEECFSAARLLTHRIELPPRPQGYVDKAYEGGDFDERAYDAGEGLA